MSFGTVFVTYPSGRMEVVELEKPTVTLGSAAENDVVLRDDAAEPFHAQMLCDDTGCQVLDLGTTSGTLFGGTPLEPYLPEPLADRAIFTIGAVTMLYCVPEADEPAMEEPRRLGWFARTMLAVSSYWRKNAGG